MNQHWNGKENLEEQLFSISNEMDIFFFNNQKAEQNLPSDLNIR